MLILKIYIDNIFLALIIAIFNSRLIISIFFILAVTGLAIAPTSRLGQKDENNQAGYLIGGGGYKALGAVL